MKLNLDKERLINCITEAETNTRGEILPVIVSQSNFYPGARWRSVSFFMLLSLALALFMQKLNAPFTFLQVMIGGVFGFYACDYPFLIRPFLLKSSMEREVKEKALENFFFHGVHETEGRSGILLMVSLLEHRVELLADRGISEKVDPAIWEDTVSNLVKRIKNGELQAGLEEAISECGKILKEKFPHEGENPNELKNRVIIS